MRNGNSKSRVIKVSSTSITGNPIPEALEHLMEMLKEGFRLLFDNEQPILALKKLFPPGKRIGIKPNCVAGIRMSSSSVLCEAIIELLKLADTREEEIIIWERSERELKNAGYPINRSNKGVRVIGNDSPGSGYTYDFSTYGEVNSLVTKVLTDMVDYHINFPILKDHSFYGAVHNPNKYHDNNCDPYAADIYCFPEIKNKNLLTVMDCFKIQYNSGPAYNSKYAVNSNFILISDDPVALDVVAVENLARLRQGNGLRELKAEGRYPSYLKTAADENHRLGNCNSDMIEQIEIFV